MYDTDMNRSERKNSDLTASRYTYKEEDPEYLGEPLNPLLMKGPIETRKCRDWLCCLIFFFTWIAVFIIAGYSFADGKPYLLLHPFDSSGKQCGISPGYQSYENVYFNQSNPAQFACIDTCPPTARTVNQSTCKLNDQIMDCTSFGSYGTELIAKICYPSGSAVAFIFDIGLEIGEEWMADVATTYPATIGVFVVSIIFSVIFLVLTKAFTKCMVWSSIVLHLVFLVGLGVLTYEMAEDPHFASEITDYSMFLDPTYLRVISYILWGIAAISLIFMLCSIKKIGTAVRVIKKSTKLLADEPSIILVPISISFILIIVVAFYLAVFVYMFSMGTVVPCDASPYGCVDWNVRVRRFFGFACFGFLWSCLFIVHLTQFLVSSVAAHWYFYSLKKHPIWLSVKNMLLYHMGSIAFGSIVLSIMAIFRIFLQLVYDCRPNQPQNNANCIKKTYYKCMTCFICTFQRFLQFVTRNAYIMMAIGGQSFCNSAHISFYIIKKHARSYLITHDLSTVLTVFSKLTIASLISLIGYLVITAVPYFSDALFSPTFPTFIFFVVSWVVASVFMDVLGNTSDSVLMCMLLGREFGKELGEQTGQDRQLLALLTVR